MALVLTDYTSGDQVRAVLGVNTKELKDTQLTLSVYLSGLLVDLNSINPGIKALYETVDAIDPPEDRTDPQAAFYEAVQLYSTYSVASMVVGTLSLLAVKRITDGKAGIDRFGNDPYKAIAEEVRGKLALYRANLLEAYLALDPNAGSITSTQIVGIRAVAPASNPVTGE